MGSKKTKQAAARKVAAEKATAEEHALLELGEEVDVRAKVADAVTTLRDAHGRRCNKPGDLE